MDSDVPPSAEYWSGLLRNKTTLEFFIGDYRARINLRGGTLFTDRDSIIELCIDRGALLLEFRKTF